MAGHLYCARFEGVLDTIERDSYALRANYHERRNRTARLEIVKTGVSVTLRHVAGRR